MNNGGGRERFPFTASQWQELEQQALIFKYIISGLPVPPHLLLFPFKPTTPLRPSPNNREWSCLQMGVGRRFDPEPGRCRRTDGKKWRCSKEAFPDSKYCDKHMHRGKNRSRKPTPPTHLHQQQQQPTLHFLPHLPPPPRPLQFLPPDQPYCPNDNYRGEMHARGEEKLQFAQLGREEKKNEEGDKEEEKRTTLCFLDEWQWKKSKKGVEESWCSSSSSTSMTQLSISTPPVVVVSPPFV